MELLLHRLGHISTISLKAGDNSKVWNYIELRIDPHPLCTICQISSINKNAISQNPLKPKAPFKWVFMDIITATSPNVLTSETIFSNYFLIVDAESKIKTLWYVKNLYIRSDG